MDKTLIVVSGLPRTGTSMVMRMLMEGGVEIVTDGLRSSDECNPHGYFELEKVKTIPDDASWLKCHCGKAVKIVSELLEQLPADINYKVIFMERNLAEVIASQQKMLTMMGVPVHFDGGQLTGIYENHLIEVKSNLRERPNCDVLCLNYNEVIENPHAASLKIIHFLSIPLDAEKMAAAVDIDLYRNRAEAAISAKKEETNSTETDKAELINKLKSLGYM
ncbi:MAG: sulfotransferase domain-containing protein [Nitrospirae bacterium]|nr:sulfotransferase domain-containing protein [Nitrospirota bacterium]